MSETQNDDQSDAVEISDLELVRRICDGDQQALAILVDRFGGQVESLCRRICADQMEASGVVSEVFWVFWRNASSFQAQRGSLRAYLLTIARSRSIDRVRLLTSRTRQQHKFLEMQGGSDEGVVSRTLPETSPMDAEASMQLRKALDQLPSQQRQMLHLAFFDGLTHQQVASQMRLPLGTVKTYIRKGLQNLKLMLSESNEVRTSS